MSTLRIVLRTALNVAVYGVLLFVPAGTLRWPAAWTLLALVFIAMLATRFSAFGAADALIAERRKPPFVKDQPFADKVLVGAFLVVIPAFIAFIPLDVFHLHLMMPPVLALTMAGLLLAGAGWTLIAAAFSANAFAVPIVKDQSDRGQTVIDGGIYAFIRHPLYAGVVLTLIGIALWLGSVAAALTSVVPFCVIVARIVVEEKFLRTRLTGYDAYAARVRYRLVPGIW